MKPNTKNTETMKITNSAYYAMLNYIGSLPAESGGALFGYEEDNVIRRFVPDEDAQTTSSSYTMNTDFLNPTIKQLWENESLSLLGIAHSHPQGSKYLSNPDKNYFTDLLKDMPRKKFYTPIIFAMPDGKLDVFPYVFSQNSKTPNAIPIEIVPDDHTNQTDTEIPIQSIEKVVDRTVFIVHTKEVLPSLQSDKTKDKLLILFSIALVFGFVFIVTLYTIPVFLQLILKMTSLWN